MLRAVEPARPRGAGVPRARSSARSRRSATRTSARGRPSGLIALYRRLERELLRHWRPPLVNDFFAMIYFGVLGRLDRALAAEARRRRSANDLLCGEGGIISTEPARRVMALARPRAASPELSDLLAREPDDRAVLEPHRHGPELPASTRQLAALPRAFRRPLHGGAQARDRDAAPRIRRS